MVVQVQECKDAAGEWQGKYGHIDLKFVNERLAELIPPQGKN